jgi:general secretion pathway protein L
MRIPFSNVRKIGMVLPFELESALPYPIDDLVIDFQTTGTTESGDHTDLIAAAIEKAQLNVYLDALSILKIDPEMATISGLPTVLALAGSSDPGEGRLFIEIDSPHITLFVTVGGQIQLIRSFLVPTPAKSEFLCSQIRRTLAAFEEMSGHDFQPLDVIVTGSGLDGTHLQEDIAGILKIPVKTANLLERLNIPIENEIEHSWNHARMDNALALALMEIEELPGLNFHKGQFAIQKFLAKHKSQVLKTAILAAAVLALFFFNVLLESYTLNKQINQINDRMTAIYKATFPDAKKIVDPYMEMKANLQQAQKSSVLQAETGTPIRSIDILNRISQRIPNETAVDITRLVISPENVLISGNTESFNAVDDIKGRLEGIDFFKKVTISSANVDKSGKQVRFMLKAEL